MADRPVQETANRPATGAGAEPAAKGPVLPPMPPGGEQPKPSSNGRLGRGKKAPKQQAPAPTPAPAPAADDTAVRRPSRPVQARLSDTDTQRVAPVAAPTGAPAPSAPAASRRPAPQQAPGRPAPVSPGPAPIPTPTAKQRPVAAAPHRPPRRARLRLTRIDPTSVMKTAFLLSIAIGIVTIIAVMTVWAVLGAAGVWDSINSTVTDVVGGDSASNFDVTDYVGLSRVLGFTTLVAVADVVLLTALATLGAFLYNMAAALLGGIEVTLAEED